MEKNHYSAGLKVYTFLAKQRNTIISLI